MTHLDIWFLDVGHGDCAYLELPNGAKMMIDCGGADNWPSRLLKYCGRTREKGTAKVSEAQNKGPYGLDKLVISHLHGDHLSDIAAIHGDIGFHYLTGNYGPIIDDIKIEEMDFRKRGQDAARKFVEIVKSYSGGYDASSDYVAAARPICTVNTRRFINYSSGVDLNDISYFVSMKIGGHKILFPGNITATGVRATLASPDAQRFKDFVSGTTVLKVPHHGREN